MSADDLHTLFPPVVEKIAERMNELLAVEGFPDYPGAVNGLQVEGDGRAVRRIGAAVDAGEAVLEAAMEAEVDLLIVHHGLFWGGTRPLVGPHRRKWARLLGGGMAVYSAHLPLDAHPKVGNGAILAGKLGLLGLEPFGETKGRSIGWIGGATPVGIRELAGRARAAIGGGPVRTLGGGAATIDRVAVVTGGGASFLEEAVARGAGALVTGEAAHPHYHEALEAGIHLLLAGHYATETFGVRALAEWVSERSGIPWVFLDHPTGL